MGNDLLRVVEGSSLIVETGQNVFAHFPGPKGGVPVDDVGVDVVSHPGLEREAAHLPVAEKSAAGDASGGGSDGTPIPWELGRHSLGTPSRHL